MSEKKIKWRKKKNTPQMGMGAHSACYEPSWDSPLAFLNALCDQLAQLQQVA
jgi:hypothetical protein